MIFDYYDCMKQYKNIITFVWSKDMEKSLSFYTEILGFQQGATSDNWIELAVPGMHSAYFALNKWTREEPVPVNNFITLGVENLDNFKKHLIAENVKMKGETEFYEEGVRLLKFLDPDGNTITAAEVESN